ncbi:MAG: hypothetical protein PHD93_01390 [Candidatus Pacebacteria bacterium]|nr:hypothetical protein [Candidatus Paceibacterota bacterium]
MNQKGIAPIFIVILVLVIIGGSSYYLIDKNRQEIKNNQNQEQKNNNQVEENYELPEKNLDDLKIFDVIEYKEGEYKTIEATLFYYGENGSCMLACYFNVDIDGISKIKLKRYTGPVALTKGSKITKIDNIYYLDFIVQFSDVAVYGYENNRMNLDTGAIEKISITHCRPTEKYKEAIGINNNDYIGLMEKEKEQNKDIDGDGIVGGNKCETTIY